MFRAAWAPEGYGSKPQFPGEHPESLLTRQQWSNHPQKGTLGFDPQPTQFVKWGTTSDMNPHMSTHLGYWLKFIGVLLDNARPRTCLTW